jgi:hypothetical protein
MTDMVNCVNEEAFGIKMLTGSDPFVVLKQIIKQDTELSIKLEKVC